MECDADAADQNGGSDHLNDCIDTDKRHDERDHISAVHQSLHIFGIAEQEHERAHKERSVEECSAESADEERSFFLELGDTLEDEAYQQPVERSYSVTISR